MNRDSRKLLYDVHGWAGFVVGIALLIACLSGAVAVFAPEIDRWSNPMLQADPDAPIRVDPDQALVRLDEFASLAEEADREISIELPNRNLPDRYGIIYPSARQGFDYAYLDAISGNVPGLVQQGVCYVLFDRATGLPLEISDVRTKPFWMQFHYALEPVHYGYFGGFWVKLLYLIVGLLPAALSITGTLLWFERRRRESRASTANVGMKANA